MGICSSRGVCFVAPSKTPGLTNSKLWGCRLTIACLCTPIVQGDNEACTVHYCDSWDDRLVLMHVVVVDYVPLTSMVGYNMSKPLRLPGLANRRCCNSLVQGHVGGEAGWHVTEDGV